MSKIFSDAHNVFIFFAIHEKKERKYCQIFIQSKQFNYCSRISILLYTQLLLKVTTELKCLLFYEKFSLTITTFDSSLLSSILFWIFWGTIRNAEKCFKVMKKER